MSSKFMINFNLDINKGARAKKRTGARIKVKLNGGLGAAPTSGTGVRLPKTPSFCLLSSRFAGYFASSYRSFVMSLAQQAKHPLFSPPSIHQSSITTHKLSPSPSLHSFSFLVFLSALHRSVH